MHFVRTCKIIFILTFSFFKSKSITKKIAKVIEDEIDSNLFEMYKGTEKVLLIKFVEVIPFNRTYFF